MPKRRILSVWRAMLILSAILPALLSSLFLRPGSGAWNLATGAWAALFLFFYLYYLPARLRRLSLKVEDGHLVLTSGVFNRAARRTPTQAVQHITLYASPLHRRWDLATLVISAPGGRMIMPGLGSDEAQRLMQVILNC